MINNDYSFLFSSLNSSNSSGLGNLNFLSDYASIKNGSYGKLMKAYYSETRSDAVSSLAASKSNSISEDDSKALKEMQSATDSLKESADALLSKALFEKKDITVENEDGTKTTKKDYDRDAIYSAVSQFVEDYNAVLDTSEKISSKSILNKTMNMVTAMVSNESMLSKLGISIEEDSTLKIDKDTFLKADMGTAKTLFGSNGSLGYRVSAQSSLINFAVTNEVNRANTYTQNGTFSSTYSSGNLFTGFF